MALAPLEAHIADQLRVRALHHSARSTSAQALIRQQEMQLIRRVRSLDLHHGAHAEDPALDVVRVHVVVLQILGVSSQGQIVVEGNGVRLESEVGQ